MRLQNVSRLAGKRPKVSVEFASAPARRSIYHSDPNRQAHPGGSNTRGRHVHSLDGLRSCRSYARECWQPSLADSDWISIVSECPSHSRNRPPDRSAAPRLQGQLDQTVSSVRRHLLRNSMDTPRPLRDRVGRCRSPGNSRNPPRLMDLGVWIYANPVSQRDLCDLGILQSGSRSDQPAADIAS